LGAAPGDRLLHGVDLPIVRLLGQLRIRLGGRPVSVLGRTAGTTPAASAPGRTAAPRRAAGSIRAVVYHAAVSALAFLSLYPLPWMAASSFKPADEIWTNVTSLLPGRFTLENYAQGWAGFGGVSFAIFFRNSLIYAGLGTILTVCSSAVT